MADLAARLASRGERVELAPWRPGVLAVLRLPDSRTVGRLAVVPESPSELIAWELCIDEAERGYGAGSEAARLFVDGAQRAGWARLRARAHPEFGLSVYFWIRMGFRPLHGEEPAGGIWFVRHLNHHPG